MENVQPDRKRKIIQFSHVVIAAKDGYGENYVDNYLKVLCDDGSMWEKTNVCNWYRIDIDQVENG